MSPPAADLAAAPPAQAAFSPAAWRPRMPGLGVAAGLAGLAWLIGLGTGLSSVLVGLLLGLGLAPFARGAVLRPGLEASARPVLRFGVALLGIQITLPQIAALGLEGVAPAVGGVALCLAAGYWIGRRLGLARELALVAAGSVAICGASAALAIAAILPGRREGACDVAATVAGITLLGALGMLVLPALGLVAGLDDRELGIFLGASLHEVAQAVGAGFAVSPEAGQAAATVKLVRVACLVPVVATIALLLRRSGGGAGARGMPPLPLFLVAFLLLAMLASVWTIPSQLAALLAAVSRFCLLAAIVALGLMAAPREMIARGPALLGALSLSSILLAAFVLLAVVRL